MRKRLSLQVSNLSDILDEVTVYLKLSFSKYNEQGGKSLVNKYLFKDTKEYMYISLKLKRINAQLAFLNIPSTQHRKSQNILFVCHKCFFNSVKNESL